MIIIPNKSIDTLRDRGLRLTRPRRIILNLVEYEKVRVERRREIAELKKARRVSVGRYLTFVFENRSTVWFQIQEMVRAERIVETSKIAEELEVYNALSAVHFVRFALPPAARQLFATAEVALVIEHPNERARTVLSDETKRSLRDDLA